MITIDLQRLRWAQQMELLELHRELTQRRRMLTEGYKQATCSLATVEFWMSEAEEHLRKLES